MTFYINGRLRPRSGKDEEMWATARGGLGGGEKSFVLQRMRQRSGKGGVRTTTTVFFFSFSISVQNLLALSSLQSPPPFISHACAGTNCEV